MLESSRFADEVSTLVFCSMMSQYDIVLLGCLLPDSAPAGIGLWAFWVGGGGGVAGIRPGNSNLGLDS